MIVRDADNKALRLAHQMLGNGPALYPIAVASSSSFAPLRVQLRNAGGRCEGPRWWTRGGDAASRTALLFLQRADAGEPWLLVCRT